MLRLMLFALETITGGVALADNVPALGSAAGR